MEDLHAVGVREGGQEQVHARPPRERVDEPVLRARRDLHEADEALRRGGTCQPRPHAVHVVHVRTSTRRAVCGLGDASENFEDWSGYIRRTSDGFSWRKEVRIICVRSSRISVEGSRATRGQGPQAEETHQVDLLQKVPEDDGPQLLDHQVHAALDEDVVVLDLRPGQGSP